MNRRTFLSFSLRCRDAAPLHEIAGVVADALHIALERVHGHKIASCPVYEGRTLGLVITLLEWPWPRPGDIGLFQLHGTADVAYIENADVVSIDGYIIELLRIRSAGDWHVPSESEIDIETHYELDGQES